MKSIRLTSAALALTLGMTAFAGCGVQSGRDDDRSDRSDIQADVDPGMTVEKEIRNLSDDEADEYREAYLDFSFGLLNRCIEEEGQGTNVMISPASVMLALDMTAAGARGETLAQIVGLYGGTEDPQGQLSYAAEMMDRINSSEGVSLHAANSMWVNENIIPEGLDPEFVSFVEDYYDAESESLEFDGAACDRINGWVDDKTDGMIPSIVQQLNPSMAMMLINAIAFDGKWETQYDDYAVQNGIFTAADGTEQQASMMCSTESLYFENDLATGFAKYYEGGQYAFVVMLPKDDDQNAGEMLAGFSGEEFSDFLASGTRDYDVITQMPEFSYDWDLSICSQLMDLGMEVPFSGDADLSGIPASGTRDLYIGDVLHKTHIDVDRNGTRAAAVTAVIVYRNAIDVTEREQKEVICDRPYAYAIVDMTNQTPIFIGTVNEI